MAKKKNTIPSGFDDILGNIYSNPEGNEGVSNMDDMLEPNTPLEDDTKNEEPPVNTEEGNVADQVDPQVRDDDSPIPDNIDNTPQEPIVEPQPVEEPKSDEPTTEDINEAQQVSLLFDAVAEQFGWNTDEIEEDTKPVDVQGLVKYLTDVVTENSVPQYADDRIQALDEFVKNGGRFEDFYARQQEALTLDNIDLEDENNQKAVVRELMKRSGYSDEQINKRITRFEDADMLYDESEDALDRLKQIRKQELEEATARQQEYARMQEEQSRAFFNAVSNDINQLTSIRGIQIPKEDRRALFDYIFKVDQTGKSQYTKDFEKNLSKNLIESAYFTMKADALISSAKKNGETSAAQKLQKALRHSVKNHTVYNVEDKQRSVTDIVNGMF